MGMAFRTVIERRESEDEGSRVTPDEVVEVKVAAAAATDAEADAAIERALERTTLALAVAESTAVADKTEDAATAGRTI